MTNTRPQILIADDDPEQRAMLQMMLADEDYDLLDFESGNQLLEKIIELVPDLILLDVEMPGLNGLEVCERLKEDPATAMIPVIIISSLALDEDQKAGLDAGAIDYITKPVEIDNVLQAVKTVLEFSQQN